MASPSRPQTGTTLKMIASRVGVSAMTVSRALSDKSNMVNRKLVERIKQVAEELGYKPNLMARSLRGEQLPTVVVFAEFISSHQYLAELVDAVSRSIEQRKYSVIACQSSTSLLETLRQFKLAGAIILAPPETLFYDDRGRPDCKIQISEPALVIHSAVEQRFFNEVSPDVADGAFQAATHLVGLGHRKIGFLGGADPRAEPLWFAKRRTGIEKALAGGSGSRNLHYQPCPNADLAPAALQQLLRADADITGLICLNDEMAVAAIHGAHAMGLKVPKDLSVVGGNDIRLARFFRPALTTLAIDVHALVETGLNVLWEEIRRGPRAALANPIKVLQKCQLIVRESTAKPRA